MHRRLITCLDPVKSKGHLGEIDIIRCCEAKLAHRLSWAARSPKAHPAKVGLRTLPPNGLQTNNNVHITHQYSGHVGEDCKHPVAA